MAPVRIFCSYAHKDEKMRALFEEHLASLRRGETAIDWHDYKIVPGTDWRAAIDEELARADIVVALVTKSFLASDFCFSEELKIAMQRFEEGKSIVIPVILRPCDWKNSPLAKLKVLPKDGKAVTDWPTQDHGYADAVEGIRQAIAHLDEFRAKAPAAPEPANDIAKEGVLAKIFGEKEYVRLAWMRAGLDIARAVARIETDRGPLGTGFLIEWKGRPAFVTNQHVLGMVPLNEVNLSFELAGIKTGVARVLWVSEVNELDVAVVELDQSVAAAPIPIAETIRDEGRVFTIGHPFGGPLTFSLFDGQLLERRGNRIAYRLDTDPGSGGGPVFDHQWRALAVHRSRHDDVCEGTLLGVVREAAGA